MFRYLVIATVFCATVMPVAAQNLQVNDSYFYTLHGRLVAAPASDELGNPISPFPAIQLATPIDLSCTAGDPMCQPETGQALLHLVLHGDEAWSLYEANIGAPVTVSGELFHSFNGNHSTPVLLSVAELAPLPPLAIPASDGRYVSELARCGMAPDDFTGDDFLEATAVAGSLRLEGYEFACVGLSANQTGSDFQVSGGCSGEGEDYEIEFPLSVPGPDQLVIDDRPLLRCLPPPPAAAPLVAEPLTIDLRPALADKLYYGSREGMQVTLRTIAGRGTVAARIVAEHSDYDAYAFCAFYAGTPTLGCIEERLRMPLEEAVTADCITGTFSDFHGARYRFVGPAPAEAFIDYTILDQASGKPLDGSGASGYDTTLAIYRALCPGSDAGRPLISVENYPREFDRLVEWQGRSLFNNGGVAGLPIMQFAAQDRPDIGRLVWTRLGAEKLAMHGQYGFASRDNSSVVVDFARRQIYLCHYDNRRARETSYRFGTVLAEGIDGFKAPCAATVDEALEEYLPLVSEYQAITVSDMGEDEFGVPWRTAEQGKDLLGLGKVIYHDVCRPEPEFNPEWFSIFGSNWVDEARFEAGGVTCHIAGSTYLQEQDALLLESVCSAAGYDPGTYMTTIARTLTGGLTFDDQKVSQCASHYFEALSYYGMQPLEVAPSVTELPLASMHEGWDGETLYRFGDVEASLHITEDDSPAVTLAASQAGEPLAQIDLPSTTSGAGAIGIYPMGQDGAPWLLFASYSGGASCCSEIVGIPLSGEDHEAQRIGPFYGDRWIPEDVDGDGRYEYVLDDDRFNYIYGGPPASFRPIEIYAERNGRLENAVAEPRYRHAVQAAIAIMDAHCGGEQGWFVSACLGWAATGARLGTYDAVMSVIQRRMDGATLPDDWQGPNHFAPLASAIEAQLVELGYRERA